MNKKQAQQKINDLNNVCDYCGRKLQPLKMKGEHGQDDYYLVGCEHGMDGFGHITRGVPIGIYKVAVNLVLDNGYKFFMKEGDDFEYQFQKAVNNACSIISEIKYMYENPNPRYTKKELKEKYKYGT